MASAGNGKHGVDPTSTVACTQCYQHSPTAPHTTDCKRGPVRGIVRLSMCSIDHRSCLQLAAPMYIVSLHR